MQSDVVEKLFDEPGSTFRDDFAGFTFYRNSVAPSNGTFLSIPATLTGRYFDNATPYPQYIAESYHDRSVLSVLADRGYKTYVHEFLPSKILLNLDPRLITNLVKQQDYSFDNEIKYLMDLSLFRLAPHFLKRYVYNEYDWLLSNGENKSTDRGIGHQKPLPFSPEMFASSEANIVEPVFHLFHFEGSHVPFNKTRNGATIPPSRTAEAFTDKTAFALSQISVLLRRLKIIDGFDNSLIIVAGDHGFSALDDWENGNVGKGMGMNALLVKDFGSSGPVKSSDAASLSEYATRVVQRLPKIFGSRRLKLIPSRSFPTSYISSTSLPVPNKFTSLSPTANSLSPPALLKSRWGVNVQTSRTTTSTSACPSQTWRTNTRASNRYGLARKMRSASFRMD